MKKTAENLWKFLIFPRITQTFHSTKLCLSKNASKCSVFKQKLNLETIRPRKTCNKLAKNWKLSSKKSNRRSLNKRDVGIKKSYLWRWTLSWSSRRDNFECVWEARAMSHSDHHSSSHLCQRSRSKEHQRELKKISNTTSQCDTK